MRVWRLCRRAHAAPDGEGARRYGGRWNQRGTAQLPADWRSLPASDALARMGTSWARRLESAVLSVPSAVVPEERNYLLNPAHLQFREIAFGPARPFAFDPRLWKTRPRSRTRSSSR